jgi:rhodanese-related sulfurtransferase
MEEVNLKKVIEEGALIIDVRTVGEYNTEHIKGSLNIPLDKIEQATSWLLKDVPTIVCCETGNRSGTAKKILEKHGFKKVYDGGNCNQLGKFGGGSCPIK